MKKTDMVQLTDKETGQKRTVSRRSYGLMTRRQRARFAVSEDPNGVKEQERGTVANATDPAKLNERNNAPKGAGNVPDLHRQPKTTTTGQRNPQNMEAAAGAETGATAEVDTTVEATQETPEQAYDRFKKEAKEAEAAGEFAKAAELFRAIVKLKTSPWAKGRLSEMEEKAAEAAQAAQDAANAEEGADTPEGEENASTAAANAARASIEAGDYAAAIETLSNALETDEDNDELNALYDTAMKGGEA